MHSEKVAEFVFFPILYCFLLLMNTWRMDTSLWKEIHYGWWEYVFALFYFSSSEF